MSSTPRPRHIQEMVAKAQAALAEKNKTVYVSIEGSPDGMVAKDIELDSWGNITVIVSSMIDVEVTFYHDRLLSIGIHG